MAREGFATVSEAAKLVGLSRVTIHNRIKSGHYNAERIRQGKREWYEIPLSELHKDLDDPIHQDDATDAAGEPTATFTGFVNLMAGVKEQNSDIVRILEEQLRVKDTQIADAEARARRLEERLEARSWWRRLFG